MSIGKPKGSLLKFSRAFWETAVAYKGSNPYILKHYDVLKAAAEGKSYSQIAVKHGIYKQTVIDIIKKYR